jgi:ABC-type branched-subunit amino acid transport system ATPase component/branched-subunit amino acid ABC-type transport system permease component
MEKLIRFALSGAATGAVYSMMAAGLVLTYSTSGVFNFAHGAIAFSCAVLYFELNSGLHWPIVPALIATVFIFAPLLGLVLDLLMFRALAKANEAAKLVGTVGLLIAIPALTTFIVDRLVKDAKVGIRPLDVTASTVPGIGPYPAHQYEPLKGVPFSSDQTIVLIVAALMAVLLWFIVRRTRQGLLMRATVDRPALARLRGVDTNRTSRIVWMLGVFIAAMAGVIAAPLAAFGITSSNNYTLLLIVAAVAAVIGGLRSIPWAFVGGMIVGLIQNLIAGYEHNVDRVVPGGHSLSDWIPNLNSAAPYILLFGFLYLLGKQKARRTSDVSAEVPPPDYLADLPRWRRALPWVLATAFLIVYTLFLANSLWQDQVARGLAFGLIFLSFVVVTGIGGMVSLAQTAFVTVAALTAGVAISHGWPILAAVLLGAAVATLLGALVALPALRLGGLPLALATLALGFIGFEAIFQIRNFGGPADNSAIGWAIPRPKIGPIDLHSPATFAMVLLVLVGLVSLGIYNLQRSATGRTMISVRTAESAAATSGASIVKTKLAVFALSAFIAGLGGVFLKMLDGRISFPDTNLYPTVGLIWLAVVVTFGVRRPGGAVVAGMVSQIFPRLIANPLHIGHYGFSIFALSGVALLLGALIGLFGVLRTPALWRDPSFGLKGWATVLWPFLLVPVLWSITGYNWVQLPLILFGWGAINLARNPDGVLAVMAEQNHTKRQLRAAKRAGKAGAGPSEASGQLAEVRVAEDQAIEKEVARHAHQLLEGAISHDGAGADRMPRPAATPEGDATGPPILTLDRIRAGYGEIEVLHGVDLAIERGSVTALLGANGAGKSTLCLVLSGALAPTAGRIRLEGDDVTALAEAQRTRRGIVLAPEQRGMFPGLTVDENLKVWLPGSAQRDEVYDRFPLLTRRRRQAAGDLSGGEQQMLTMAPLIVRPPAVLVADEPTLGLAPLVVEQLIEIFADLRDEGVTLLLVEEKVRDVLKIADHVTFLELGHVVWSGSRADVADERLAAAYLGAAPVVDA